MVSLTLDRLVRRELSRELPVKDGVFLLLYAQVELLEQVSGDKVLL